MSKERLEELKRMRLLYEVCFVDDYASAIDDVTADFDLLIKRVQELERVNKQLKNNLSVYKGYYKNMMKINEDIVEENKKYRELIKGMGQEIEILTDIMSSADNADELNQEAIRLKGKMEESK